MITLYEIVNFIAILGIAGTFLYWQISENTKSLADKEKGNHSSVTRLLLRALMPIAGILLALQLLSIITFKLALPSGLEQTLFILGHLVLWFGIVLAVWAREAIGQYWAHAAEYQVISGQPVITKGPYKYIRHPIYMSLLLMMIGVELAVTSWLVVLAIPMLFFYYWQAQKEEKILVEKLGEEYIQYQTRTGMFLPRNVF